MNAAPSRLPPRPASRGGKRPDGASSVFGLIVRLAAPAAALALAGCVSASQQELAGRQRVQNTGALLASATPRRAQPVPPTPGAPLADYLNFAVVNHPAVLAAYEDWNASVAAVVPARALPDPKLTFQADVARTLTSFMPGLMLDLMTPGKREAVARAATAQSAVAHRTFVATVVQTAARARNAWVELAYLDEALRQHEALLRALRQSAALAGSAYSTASGGGASLQEQVQSANEIAEEQAELGSLADRRTAARAEFKSALGLLPTDPDPAWPAFRLTASPLPNADQLWARATRANPELGRMRGMVEAAVAGVSIAREQRVPDFSVGAMADLKMNPVLVRPTATVTLPIWRHKIAANIAAAQARTEAAQARVNATELNLAAELAQSLYTVRASDRMIAYIDRTGLPNLRRVVASYEAGYQTGASPAGIPAARRAIATMRLQRAVALRDRELAATNLMLLTGDVVPESSPLLAAAAR